MSLEWFIRQIIFASIPLVPWIAAGFGAIAFVSFGPIGRAVAQRLRKGDEKTGASAAILEELNTIHGELEELIERQYTMERMLAAGNAMRNLPVTTADQASGGQHPAAPT